jgi:cytochrome bd ubiquinol oxidase subunit II
MAVVAGAAALAGLAVVHGDAERIWHGLTRGGGLGAVIASALAGAGTVAFVLRRRYGAARLTAATAVAAIVAGWGLAQRPQLLPGLTIEQGAAGHSVLVALVLSLALGALILFPSLGVLFALVLRGRFDDDAEPARSTRAPREGRSGLPLLPVAGACLVIGVGATVPFQSGWGRIVGIPALLAFVALAFVALATSLTAAAEDGPP